MSGALDRFDLSVRNKRAQPIGKLDEGAEQTTQSAASSMRDDTRCAHYRQVHLWFTKGHYAF